MQRKSSERVELLSDVPFFDGFTDADLHRVVELSDEVTVHAGHVVVDQGDPGTHCFVIISGVASVYVRGEHVAALGPGSMVGEMALVDHRPRTATVVGDTDLELLRFDSQAFSTLLEETPRASEQVMKLLRTRLAQG